MQYLRAPMTEPATPAPSRDPEMEAQPSEAKDQPAKPTLRELYTRTHWLVIADFQKTIADNEAAVGKPVPPSERWALDMIRNSIPLLRERVEEYQYQYEIAMRDGDTALMRRFLNNTRDAHSNEPEFAFLPKALPAQ